MNHRAVFLDKDGTLIENVPHNVDPSLIRLGRGAGEGLRRLQASGFRLFVISNQAGVALGKFPESALAAVEERLRSLLNELGVHLDGFFYCPHHPEGRVPEYSLACQCRKPEPGLIFSAARIHGIALEQSWFIGDILDDIEAGRRAGCRTVLINNGNETEWRQSRLRTPHYLAEDLAAAARCIITDAASSAAVPPRATEMIHEC